MILLVLLNTAGNRIFFFALADIFKGRTFSSVKRSIVNITGINRSSDIGNRAYRLAVRKAATNFNRLIFSHAVGNEISLRVKKYTSADLIVPVIVMCKTPERCLKTADNDRNIAVKLSYFIAIYNNSPVRSESHNFSRGICVLTSAFFCGCVMSDHGVNIARRNHKAELRSAETEKIVILSPIRLGKDCNTVALSLHHPCYYSRTEARMIDISVARNIDEIDLVPSSLFNFFGCYR